MTKILGVVIATWLILCWLQQPLHAVIVLVVWSRFVSKQAKTAIVGTVVVTTLLGFTGSLLH